MYGHMKKKLQFPVNIRKPDPARKNRNFADWRSGWRTGCLNALSESALPWYDSVRAMLTDIGTEETCSFGNGIRNPVSADQKSRVEEIKAGGFDAYYVDHTTGIWTQAASGAPFTAAYYQSKGVRLLICLRTWQQNRKHGQPMKI